MSSAPCQCLKGHSPMKGHSPRGLWLLARLAHRKSLPYKFGHSSWARTSDLFPRNHLFMLGSTQSDKCRRFMRFVWFMLFPQLDAPAACPQRWSTSHPSGECSSDSLNKCALVPTYSLVLTIPHLHTPAARPQRWKPCRLWQAQPPAQMCSHTYIILTSYSPSSKHTPAAHPQRW